MIATDTIFTAETFNVFNLPTWHLIHIPRYFWVVLATDISPEWYDLLVILDDADSEPGYYKVDPSFRSSGRIRTHNPSVNSSDPPDPRDDTD